MDDPNRRYQALLDDLTAERDERDAIQERARVIGAGWGSAVGSGADDRPDPRAAAEVVYQLEAANMRVAGAEHRADEFLRTHPQVTDPAKRQRATLAIRDRLPDRWHVGTAHYDPGAQRWSITARGPHPGRGKAAEVVKGTGEDELAAMADLRIRLDERQRPDKLAEIDRRGRAAFLEGAEEQSRDAEGRPPTAEELERVTRRYPDD